MAVIFELWRKLAVAIGGCVFSCFGVKAYSNHLSSPPRATAADAKFSKAGGALPETPEKFAKEQKEQSTQKGESYHKEFREGLTHTSMEKLDLERPAFQPPTPVNICQEWVKESCSTKLSPNSYMKDGQNNERVSTCSPKRNFIQNDIPTELFASPNHRFTDSSVPTSNIAPSIQCKNKSVGFDCIPDASSVSSKSYSSEISSIYSEQYGSADDSSISNPSPYPTPLKLTDEIQTPGTVFPAYLDALGHGKTNCIRSQFVHSVLNPEESLSQRKVLDDEDLDSEQLGNHTRESSEKNDEATPVLEAGMGEVSVREELKLESKLSPGLRATTSNLNGISQDSGSTVGENFHGSKTPGDKPIFGMVVAHFLEERSQISPKLWDGIANATNSDQERQKASGRAMRFEEILEKAFTEESFISQR